MKGIQYNLIAEALGKKGQTAYWLSNILGVSNATALRWCANESQPPLPVLFEIAAALKVEPRSLLVSLKTVAQELPERYREIEELKKIYPKKRGKKKK
ncbi:helix-turn-helix transcriptional regulator [Gilvibacter sp.]|uniref:helix-turn-helix transcriptional regulator n=1 Tax=Gilvibacter sp. TaxID=2729997 RepID=UPI0025C24596|nr:helix-turn-helix transcriptional regulator [Gilvibacter sp.]NQX78629.1 helix-turn-helix domain-containing protein [Gilvibacter sp.]